MQLWNILEKILQIKTDFLQLFFKNEYHTLAGIGNRRVLTLTLILFLTLLSLGFAVGNLGFLKQRMDNPFTNWVTLPVTLDIESNIPKIKMAFESSSLLDSFDLKNVDDYEIFFEKFATQDNKNTIHKRGRTFEPNSELIRKILSNSGSNVLVGQQMDEKGSESYSNPCALVITQKMMEDLGYSDWKHQLKIPIAYNEETRIYIDVAAVVKELPDMCDFACTNRFQNLLKEPLDQTGFMDSEESDKNIFSIISNKSTSEIEQILKNTLTDVTINSIKEEAFDLNSNSPAKKFDVILSDFYPKSQFKEWAKSLTQQNIQLLLLWECSSKMETLRSPSYVSFNFKRLDKVRYLKDYLKQKYSAELGMTQVEAKENFAIVSRLTFVILIVLFVFSLASIVFYVDSLLKTHLEKVKTNLGTFKAFGLSNNALVMNYLKIIASFILIATFIALVVSIAVATILNQFFDWHIKVLDYRIIIAIVLLFAISIWKSKKTIDAILSQTPGDLIYNR